MDKSLLRVRESAGDERRFGMLETIREYALDRLAEAGEETTVRDRHLSWCLGLAERAEPELRRGDQVWWLRRLDVEHDNMRVALGWAIERQHGELAQRLGSALCHFWMVRGHFDEGRRWLEQALLPPTGVAPTIRAGALLAIARLAHDLGDYQVEFILEEALAHFRAAGDSVGEADALAALSRVLSVLGDHARASAFAEDALAIFRQRGDEVGVIRLLNRQGLDAYDLGNYDRAAALFDEIIALGWPLGAWHVVAWALNNRALVALEQQDFDRSMTWQAEALDLFRGLGEVDGVASCLENFAMIAAGQHQLARAARLFAAAETLRVRIGAPGRPRDREQISALVADVRAQLGSVAFDTAWAEGAAMHLDEATVDALGEESGRL
jgi:tetratricopeptide (TPR) repeat protein